MATSSVLDADMIRPFSEAQLSNWLEKLEISLEFFAEFESMLNCLVRILGSSIELARPFLSACHSYYAQRGRIWLDRLVLGV